jgi:dTDP-4-amino-4,6-dideoxygalactose transaminase
VIPLCVPDLSGNEARYLAECIETTFVSSVGPFVSRFETMVAEAAGGRFGVATSSGTTALHLALAAAGVERDDLVIVPSYTFIASANAITHAGAVPWLMDIDADSWTLDPRLMASVLAAETERRAGRLVHRATGRHVRAVMPVHTLGQPADMDGLVAVAREFSLKVVADGAAALGATYRGRKPGQWGADLTAFSFNGNKTVTAGGGGAVVGDDERLMATVRHLCSTARVGADYTHDRVGFNYRLTNLQAAVGCAQMERLDVMVAAKRSIRDTYDAAFRGLPGVALFPRPVWADGAAWVSGFVLDSVVAVEGLRGRLRDAGIDSRPFWKPVHLQAPYASTPRSSVTVSESLWERVLTLPCSTGLVERDVQYVIKTAHRILCA